MANSDNLVCDFNSEAYSAKSSINLYIDLTPDSNTGGDCLNTWSATGSNYADDAIMHSQASCVTFFNSFISDRGVSKWKFWSDDEVDKNFYLTLIKRVGGGDEPTPDDDDFTNDSYIIRLRDESKTEISCCASGYDLYLDAIDKKQNDSGETTDYPLPLSAIDVTYSYNNGLTLINSASTNCGESDDCLFYQFKIANNCIKGGDSVDNLVYFTLKDKNGIDNSENYAGYDLLQRTYDESVEMSASTDDKSGGSYVKVVNANTTAVTFTGISYFRRYYCEDDLTYNQAFDDLMGNLRSNNFNTLWGRFNFNTISPQSSAVQPQKYALKVTGVKNSSNTSIARHAIGMTSEDGNVGQVFEIVQKSTDEEQRETGIEFTVHYQRDEGMEELSGGCSLRVTLSSRGSRWSDDVVLGHTPYTKTGDDIIYQKKYEGCILYDVYSVEVKSVYIYKGGKWHTLGEQTSNGRSGYTSNIFVFYNSWNQGDWDYWEPILNNVNTQKLFGTPNETMTLADKPTMIDGTINRYIRRNRENYPSVVPNRITVDIHNIILQSL